jgi:hypothetical protein
VAARASPSYSALFVSLLIPSLPRLQMRHDPELSVSFEQPPRSWKEAGPLGQGSEEEFQEGMKHGLSRCVCAW